MKKSGPQYPGLPYFFSKLTNFYEYQRGEGGRWAILAQKSEQ